MITQKFNGFFVPGTRTDICDLCIKKLGINKTMAKRDERIVGKLEGKPIHRVNYEICYCKECIEKEIDDYNKGETNDR